jgi:hypothetical protein
MRVNRLFRLFSELEPLRHYTIRYDALYHHRITLHRSLFVNHGRECSAKREQGQAVDLKVVPIRREVCEMESASTAIPM